MVQNRFYKETAFDSGVRAFCEKKGLTYQAFWMLTHNPEMMASGVIKSVSERLEIDKELAFYLLILGLGATQVLCGATNPDRIRRDLEVVVDIESNQAAYDKLQPSVDVFMASYCLCIIYFH